MVILRTRRPHRELCRRAARVRSPARFPIHKSALIHAIAYLVTAPIEIHSAAARECERQVCGPHVWTHPGDFRSRMTRDGDGSSLFRLAQGAVRALDDRRRDSLGAGVRRCRTSLGTGVPRGRHRHLSDGGPVIPSSLDHAPLSRSTGRGAARTEFRGRRRLPGPGPLPQGSAARPRSGRLRRRRRSSRTRGHGDQ